MGNSISKALFNLRDAKKRNTCESVQTASVLSRTVQHNNSIYHEAPWQYVVTFRLVQTREDRQYVVPLRIHPVFFNRCRVYSGEIKEVTEKTETQDFRLGTRQYHVTVNPDFLQVSSAGGHMGQQTRQMSQQTTLLYYQGLSLLLGLAELGILRKIRGE